MNVGIIGLGKMGNAIAYRLKKAGYTVYGYDVNPDMQEHARQIGITVVDSIATIAEHARITWLMVPIQFVDSVLEELVPHAQTDDIIVDGGNSNYKESMRRASELEEKGIAYLDCGTSGGIHGQKDGFCLMVGGDERVYKKAESLFKAVAASKGFGLVGPSGAGHYVKMVHNGIEYGLLQAYAEGFAIVKKGTFKESDLDLAQISGIWEHGSVVRSFLLSLAHDVFKKDQDFASISGQIQEGGTGKWTVQEAKDNNIDVPIIEQSLKVRAWSRTTGGNYATKFIAMLRNAFGGHAVTKVK